MRNKKLAAMYLWVERWAKRIRRRATILNGLVCHFTGFKENVGLGVRLLCYAVSEVVFLWNDTQ